MSSFLYCIFLLSIPGIVSGICDLGWKQVGFHCFKLFIEPKINHSQAVDMCDDNGGLLATIRHKKDFDTLIGMLNELTGGDKQSLYWIGLLIHRRSDNAKLLSMSFMSGHSTRFVNFNSTYRDGNCTDPWGHARGSIKEPNNTHEPESCGSIAVGILNGTPFTPGLLDTPCSHRAWMGGFFCEKKGR